MNLATGSLEFSAGEILDAGHYENSPIQIYWKFSFTLAHSRISYEYSSLFIIVINLIFMFSLWCIDWVGSLYATRIFMCFCIRVRVASGPRVKLASCKSALTTPPPVVYSADRSKAVVPVLVSLTKQLIRCRALGRRWVDVDSAPWPCFGAKSMSIQRCVSAGNVY